MRSTTVRDIADAAGILSGSLYHHFDSKESMVDEILRGFLDRLFGSYREIAAADLSARETIRRFVVAPFEAIDIDHHAVAIYQDEAPRLASQNASPISPNSTPSSAACGSRCAAGVDDGEFRADLDLELVYRFMRDTVWVAALAPPRRHVGRRRYCAGISFDRPGWHRPADGSRRCHAFDALDHHFLVTVTAVTLP